MEDRVGVEEIMVGVLQFIAFGVVKGQSRLEPAGDRVCQIRDQLSRLGHDDQLQPFAGLKPIPVHAAGQDLAVDDGRQRDVHLGGRNGFLLIVESQLPECAASGTAFDSRLVNSGSWPTQKRSGFDSPVGVASLISRSPGSAFVARVTRKVTVSAIAGFWFLLGA